MAEIPSRLSERTLPTLPEAVRRPAYDRWQLKIGIAHIGVGAFHRCHQAEFTDDMLENRFDRWGVVGINLRPPSLKKSLEPQDGLYTRTLRQGTDSDVRVIGCMRRTIDAMDDGVAAAVDALASADVAVVTLTITEKGYCHIPATGHLDQSNAELNDDIRGSVPPKTAIGLLAAGIELRRQLGAGDVTLISCDNIPSNGLLLRNVLTEFAEQRSAELARWLREHVRFPSTMVDRIVPASTPDDVRFAREVCGVEDLAPVVGEPFRQWVIEDSFASRRPDWDAAGAAFVADVHPYELMKMRLLNAAQSSFAYFGALSGLEHTFDAARDPVLRAVVRRMIVDESSPTVPPVPGVEIDKYIDLVFQRISNVAIRHRNHQVATDGSQKIVQRLLNPIRDRRQSGAGFDLLASAVAGWMAYLLAATPMFGSRWQASDPWAQEIERLAMKTGDKSLDLVRAIVGIKAIFGEGLSDGPFCAAVAAHLSGLLALNPRGYLAGLVQQSSLS